MAGADEGGAFATTALVEVSENLPIKIEILMPAGELDQVLPLFKEIVTVPGDAFTYGCLNHSFGS